MENNKVALLQALCNPVKKHLYGEVLTEQQVIGYFEQCKFFSTVRGLTSHSFSLHSLPNTDYDEVVFFSRNHLYGYQTIPEDFTSCSFGIPGHCVARPGCEDGVIDTFDKYKAVHGHKTRYLWSIQELVDFIIDEYPNLVQQLNEFQSTPDLFKGVKFFNGNLTRKESSTHLVSFWEGTSMLMDAELTEIFFDSKDEADKFCHHIDNIDNRPQVLDLSDEEVGKVYPL